jgi:hypothetical protein
LGSGSYLEAQLGGGGTTPEVDFPDTTPTDQTAEVRERDNNTDRSVSAHAESADVVEEDDPRRARRIVRRNEQRADEDVRPARLIDHRGAVPIERLLLESRPPLGQRSAAEVRPTLADDARRLALGVRINHTDALHGAEYMFAKWRRGSTTEVVLVPFRAGSRESSMSARKGRRSCSQGLGRRSKGTDHRSQGTPASLARGSGVARIRRGLLT